jgi:hypothetical protein
MLYVFMGLLIVYAFVSMIWKYRHPNDRLVDNSADTIKVLINGYSNKIKLIYDKNGSSDNILIDGNNNNTDFYISSDVNLLIDGNSNEVVVDGVNVKKRKVDGYSNKVKLINPPAEKEKLLEDMFANMSDEELDTYISGEAALKEKI